MGKHVDEVMATRPRAATPDTPIPAVAELMATEDVGAIPVLDGDRLVGMVTDRDIVIRVIARGKDPRGMTVREIATGDLVTLRADQDLSEALRLMAQHQVRRLPVVDDGDRLIGIVSQADVAREARERASGEMLEEISQPPVGPRV
jgi:CBS domain-containing protein